MACVPCILHDHGLSSRPGAKGPVDTVSVTDVERAALERIDIDHDRGGRTPPLCSVCPDGVRITAEDASSREPPPTGCHRCNAVLSHLGWHPSSMQTQDAEGSAGSQSCPHCGAEDWQVEELGSIARAWSWLQGGAPVLRVRLTCRRCGFTQVLSHGDGSMYRVAPLHETSRWGVPIRIIRALLRARTAIPSPLIYLMAGALGVGLGIVLDRMIGWPWWSVAFGSVAVVWIVFLATAFGPASRRMQPPIRTQILDALNPMGMFDRLERREEQAFRDRPFTIYGLDPSWEGQRFIGSSGWEGVVGNVSELELVHGDVSHPSGTSVRVASSPSSIGESRDRQRELAEQLWLEVEPPPPRESLERFIEWEDARERDHRSRPTPDFRTIELSVDDDPLTFSFLLEQNAWVALGSKEDVTISIIARNVGIEDVRLVTIRDVEPYIESRRRLLEPPSQTPDG